MATVWLAHDSELERPVALKILRHRLALGAKHTGRFRREALAVAKLHHRPAPACSALARTLFEMTQACRSLAPIHDPALLRD